jgi:sugar diacid utilization regulator
MSVEQIQALADGLAGRLGRAVLVDDRDLRLVAASEDFGDADPARVWSLLNRRTRPQDVRYEEIAGLTGPGYVPENPAVELWQRLCVPIRLRGLLLGFMWIIDRFGELTQEQVADSASTAAEIGVLLHTRTLADGQDRARREELVQRLLSQDADTAAIARDEAVDRGLLDDDGQAAVLLIRHSAMDGTQPNSAEPNNAEQDSALLLDVERLLPRRTGMRTLAARWPRRATVIVTCRLGLLQQGGKEGGQRGEWLTGSVRALLDELGKTGSWHLGAGGPVHGLNELSVARRQAEIALSTTGLSTTGGTGAACWPELSADALLAQFPRHSWADALLPDSVTRLLTDPAVAALLPTLDTYLNCACDVRRTATELRIHRATLYYRLDRIEKICGLSLRDGGDRLLAHLALRLHRLYGPPPRKVLGFPPVCRFGAR